MPDEDDELQKGNERFFTRAKVRLPSCCCAKLTPLFAFFQSVEIALLDPSNEHAMHLDMLFRGGKLCQPTSSSC